MNLLRDRGEETYKIALFEVFKAHMDQIQIILLKSVAQRCKKRKGYQMKWNKAEDRFRGTSLGL